VTELSVVFSSDMLEDFVGGGTVQERILEKSIANSFICSATFISRDVRRLPDHVNGGCVCNMLAACKIREDEACRSRAWGRALSQHADLINPVNGDTSSRRIREVCR
jgi:hypothetical protein